MLWRRISRHDVLAAAKREGRAAGRGASPCTYIEGHFTTGFGPMPASAMTTPGLKFSRSGRPDFKADARCSERWRCFRRCVEVYRLIVFSYGIYYQNVS